jgi:hypothetical protein
MALKRNIKGNRTYDSSIIEANIYSESAGAQKNSEVGRCLVAIPNAANGTTNATTAIALPSKGRNLAVYNNSGSLESITLGKDSSVASLAPGITDINKNVGIPCMPNEWTYIACNDKQWVIASAATLLVFLIEDETSINESR